MGDRTCHRRTSAGTWLLGFGDNAGVGSASYTFTAPGDLHNDAGLGIDAPGASGQAIDLPLGSYAGTVFYSLGDKEDWYRFSVVPCGGIRLTFSALTGSLYGGIYSDNGQFLKHSFNAGSTTTLSVAIDGPFRVGFGHQAGTGSAAYTFSVTPIHQDDAGSGCDAPGALGDAYEVGTGSFEGRLAYGDLDKEDWFRLSAPVCSAWRVAVTATFGTFWAGAYDDSGNFIDNGQGTTDLVLVGGSFRLASATRAGSAGPQTTA